MHPLLRQKSIAKEIKPVDSEFCEASNDDDVRVELLWNHIADPSHPMSKFPWGNRKSLIEDTMDKSVNLHNVLLEFHNKHYRSDNIYVVVQSQESLQNLEKWTVEVFSQVESNSENNFNLNDDVGGKQLPFESGESMKKFNSLYLVESFNSGARLMITWCLPEMVSKYIYSPLDYLSDLIGYEGKGSLVSELRRRDLSIEVITDISSHSFKNNQLYAMFTIELELTDSGEERLDEIVALVFEYFSVMRKAGAQEYFFVEHQKIALKAFNLKSEHQSLSYVNEILKNLMYFPTELLLTGSKLHYRFNPDLINRVFEDFVPEKANFVLQGVKLKPDLATLTEPWVGTKYQVEDVPQKWIQSTKSFTNSSAVFHYPKPNPFIAQDYRLLDSILPENAPERMLGKYPTRIVNLPRIVVWYKPDFTFKLPKASINVHIMSKNLNDTLENKALCDLLHEYCSIVMKEEACDAVVAELDWDFNNLSEGLLVKASGFNDKLTQLVLLLLSCIKNVQFEPVFMESMKKEVMKCYNNGYQDPEVFNQHLRLSLLVPEFISCLDRWPLIKPITKARIEQYKSDLLSNLTLDVLVQGNLTIEQVKHFTQQIESLFNLNPAGQQLFDRHKAQVHELSPTESRIRALTLSSKNNISYTVCYYQLHPFSLKSQVFLSLFVEMINEQCFNVLR